MRKTMFQKAVDLIGSYINQLQFEQSIVVNKQSKQRNIQNIFNQMKSTSQWQWSFPSLEFKQQLSKCNLKMLKLRLRSAKLTTVMITMIWIMLLIQYIYTWVVIPQKMNVAQIPSYTLLEMGANNCVLFKFGQYYRILTATLLHSGFLHAILNTAGLIVFCANLEIQLRAKIYFLIFLVGGIQGMLFGNIYNFYLANISEIGVGTSSSICAIISFNIASLYIEKRMELVKAELIKTIAYLLLVSMLPSVDFAANVGSLISGALLRVIIKTNNNKEESKKKQNRLVITAISIYGFILLAAFK